MAGNDSEWNVTLNTQHNGTFPLSRFLEYTDPDIAKGFEPISSASLSFLEKLQAVFLSELDFDDERKEIFRIRLGNVSNLSIVGREIRYTFQLTQNFGAVQVADREAFRKAFRMDSFELHRTHWAVKSADLAAALQAVIPQMTPIANATITPEPPQPIQLDEKPVNTLEEYMAHVLSLTEAPGEEIFYRGHSNFKYSLAPSLFRKNEAGAYTHLPKEEIMVREILSVQDAQFTNDRSMLDRLVRMQHFGLPTRLLDVSSNPLVALYFACSQVKKDAEGNELDGEVIILRTPSTDVLNFDSDRVSCIANLSLMKEEEKKAMDFKRDKDSFNAESVVIKLLHFIKREKPYFEPRIEPSHLQKILFVRARNTHERMISQSGAFLLFGQDAIMPETGYGSLKVSRIRIRQKANILAQLDKLNIKASSIYPGIEKAASDIAKKHEVV
ncbi:FRG domain-containing protein [Agrobacterium vitis]|nr:FRG domain-containing protein [Agrobacterium vitis]MVA61411.1 FRG domain-containing protein [Agrobacterium vitis]